MIILKIIAVVGIAVGIHTYLSAHFCHSSVCHRCGGRGWYNGSICPDCHGSGDYVEGSDPRQKEVKENVAREDKVCKDDDPFIA